MTVYFLLKFCKSKIEFEESWNPILWFFLLLFFFNFFYSYFFLFFFSFFILYLEINRFFICRTRRYFGCLEVYLSEKHSMSHEYTVMINFQSYEIFTLNLIQLSKVKYICTQKFNKAHRGYWVKTIWTLNVIRVIQTQDGAASSTKFQCE